MEPAATSGVADMVNMEKYRQLFLDEGRDHLESMTMTLAKLEDDPSNRQHIDELFRNAHSIKGMASSMGYEPIQQLSHQIEDAFSIIRDGETQAEQGILHVIYEGVDLLCAMFDEIDAEGSVTVDAETLIGQLQEFVSQPSEEKGNGKEESMKEDEGEGPAAPCEIRDGEARTRQPSDPAAEEGRLFDVEVLLTSEAKLPAARALLVFKNLEACGKIEESIPSLDDIKNREFSNTLSLKVRSTLSKEQLLKQLDTIAEIESISILPHDASSEQMDAESAATIRVRASSLDTFLNLVSEQILTYNRLSEHLKGSPHQSTLKALKRLGFLIDEMHDQLMRIRLMPFTYISNRLARTVRETARSCNKKVTFDIIGEEVRLDRLILDQLLDPLNHILRNAIDHGIESVAEREESGKAAEGRIRVNIRRQGETVQIVIRDDGSGMDADEIRRRAIDLGFVSAEETEKLAEDEILMLVTAPGFSTAEQVSEISGRGVGMDVVRTNIESLGGHLNLRSRPGQGSRIELNIPLSVAIANVFLIQIASDVFAVRVRSVERNVEMANSDLSFSNGVPFFSYQGSQVEVRDLHQLLSGEARGERPDSFHILLYKDSERLVGFHVDEVLGRKDVVIKKLGHPLEQLVNFSGATILGDGRIALILDLENLSR